METKRSAPTRRPAAQKTTTVVKKKPALVTLEASVKRGALPAVALANELETKATPFGRSAPTHLSAADARLLRRAPAPLRVLVPVTISK